MSIKTTETNSRILIVDDNRAIHQDFRKILGEPAVKAKDLDDAEASLFGDVTVEPSGPHYQLDSAFQGEEALGLIQQALNEGRPYAMAFMDVRMPPGCDGIETTVRLWEIDPDIQVVICTAYSDYSWEEMLRKLGHSDRAVILKKPFDNIEVLQMANSLTRKWQFLQESKIKMTGLEEMVAARTAQMVQEQEKFRAIFENSPDGILQTTPEGRFLSANPAMAAILKYASPAELMEAVTDIGTQLYLSPEPRAELKRRLETEKIVRNFEIEMKCKDGSVKWMNLTASQVARPDGSLLCYQGFAADITAQKSAQQERNLMEAHLRQAQKLESVGQLAAGIAHEINTPIQFIGDNIRFVGEAFVDLSRLITEQQKLITAVPPTALTPEMLAALEASAKGTDFAYLSVEVPKAINQSLDGVKHVANIVCAMKEFSHPGQAEKVPVDLNHAIETTLTVARNEWRYVADVVTDFAPNLPLVPCLPGEFNQVILNLVVNAAHAIGDVIKNQKDAKGTIKIGTRLADSWVEIRIADTGAGIPEGIRPRIFEPFFTTKEVGKGTGQGLAIARSTIVKKHGGELNFESTVGEGTTFIIRLPLTSPPPANKKPVDAGK